MRHAIVRALDERPGPGGDAPGEIGTDLIKRKVVIISKMIGCIIGRDAEQARFPQAHVLLGGS
jgi:hypothetical protein